jgi:hypothetical protein
MLSTVFSKCAAALKAGITKVTFGKLLIKTYFFFGAER